MKQLKKTKTILLATTIILGITQKGWSADGGELNRAVERPTRSSRVLRELPQETRHGDLVPLVVHRELSVETGRTINLGGAGGSFLNFVFGGAELNYQGGTDSRYNETIIYGQGGYQAPVAPSTPPTDNDDWKPKLIDFKEESSTGVERKAVTSSLTLDTNREDSDFQRALQHSIDSYNSERMSDIEIAVQQSRESYLEQEARTIQQAQYDSLLSAQFQRKRDAQIAEDEQLREILRFSEFVK